MADDQSLYIDALNRLADVAEHIALTFMTKATCDPDALLAVFDRHTGCPLCKVLQAKANEAERQSHGTR